MLSLLLLLPALLVDLSLRQATVKEDGWISTCAGAGCHGRHHICLTYHINGQTYYCYRNVNH